MNTQSKPDDAPVTTGLGPRWDYAGTGLDIDETPETPWPLYEAWTSAAIEAAASDPRVHEPMSMAVATVDEDGLPDVREVLVRFLDPAGPGFVTSTRSAKAVQLTATPVIAGALTWTSLYRAIRLRGVPGQVGSAETEAYWHRRPWDAKVAAIASHQSAPIDSRSHLQQKYDEVAARYEGVSDIPVPDDWVAYRIRPLSVEFWVGRPGRLHDRLRYTRNAPADLDDPGWERTRLQP